MTRFPYQQVKSKSGSSIHLFKRKNVPLALRAVFDAGARYDQKAGTTHFLEHMLVAGSKKFFSKNKLSEYIESVGGQFRATTSIDYLYIDLDLAGREDLDIGIDVLHEMLTQPLFNSGVLEKERGAIIAEFQRKKANPTEYIWQVYRRLFFQGTKLERPVLGYLDSIQDITRNDIVNFFRKFITNDRVTYILAGDADINEVKKKIDKNILLGDGEKIVAISPLAINHNKHIDIEFYDIDQVRIICGFRTHSPSLKEKVALDIALNYMCLGRSSELISQLRYNRGLIYEVGGNHTTANDWGSWVISTACSPRDLTQVMKIISTSLAQLREKTLPEEKLELRKNMIKKSTFIKLQTSQALVSFNQEGLLLGKKQFTINDYLKVIDNVTLDDIQSAVQTHLLPEDYYIALCGPKGCERGLI